MSLINNIQFIDSSIDLISFVKKASASNVLAIDTEFIREKTYYPNLCLIQLATENDVAIIDPFAISDLSPLNLLIEDNDIVKLFHAGSQDLEIIYRELGILPKNIFDVQAAAALLGHSQQAGLAILLSSFLNINIKKSDSFTDWSRRPLAKSQIIYAAEDVIYLPKLHKVMTAELDRLGRSDWLNDDYMAMCDPSKYEENPYERYRRLKKGNQLTRKQLAAAKEVTAWREIQAQKRDIPRKWILSDEQIVESCKREPKTIDELFLIRGIKNSLSTRDARTIIQLMNNAFRSDPATWPKLEVPIASEKNVDSAIDLLSALVRVKARENDIAMQTLASHSDLVLVARGYYEESAVMNGWRRHILAEDIMSLLKGEISLYLDGDNLVIKRN